MTDDEWAILLPIVDKWAEDTPVSIATQPILFAGKYGVSPNEFAKFAHGKPYVSSYPLGNKLSDELSEERHNVCVKLVRDLLQQGCDYVGFEKLCSAFAQEFDSELAETD